MKKLLMGAGVLVPILFIGVYFFGSAVLAKVAKAGVEVFMPQVTGTTVQMAGLSVSPLTGSGTVEGFVLGNPDGFKADHSIRFDRAHLDVAPFSILGDRILIEKVHVYAPSFVFEKKLLTSNINEILKNVRVASGRAPEEGEAPAAEGTAPPAAAESTPIKVEIRELVIDEGQVSFSMAGATVPIPVPKIVLRDIGTDAGGIPPDEMVFEVMSVVLKQVINAAATSPGGAIEGIKNIFGGGKG